MADDGVANGGVDDQYGEESTTKIEVLQREHDELVNENATRKEEIKKLTVELDILRRDGATNIKKIEEMQREMAQSRDAAKAAEVIATRATDLETNVARLQHDLISEMAAAEEARADASELRKNLGEKSRWLSDVFKKGEGIG
ncbi:peroxisomal and mitochondrial division factor 2-like [Vigna angularis]|uniref:peroxisomal and mitochondrial division factor 2-like n=1 Tax=Phaseolus angularis TaxID=3914 RepID=UPI000809CAEE|nr:peroxisomal and mitochondrial division factor 2-like [Vigna angularis]